MDRDDAYRRPMDTKSSITSAQSRATHHIVNGHAFTTANVLASTRVPDVANDAIVVFIIVTGRRGS